MDHRHLTTGEAARVAGVSTQTVIRCCDAGDLQHFKVPLSKYRRISRRWLEEWAKRHGIELDWTTLDTRGSECDH